MRVKMTGLLVLWALIAATLPGAAVAQPFPNRPIKMIVPFPAGGGADVLARIVTHYMSEDLGQSVVILNTPGNGGGIAFAQTAKAEPDGYTISWTSVLLPVTAVTMDGLSFDVDKDFTHIGEVAQNPFIFVVNPKLPVKSVAELIALAKSKPGKLNLAHNGNGTLTKLVLDLLQLQAGIDITQVAYRGDNFSIVDIIAGHVDGMFSNSPVALPYMGNGELRGLAVTSPKRSPAAPDLPTMLEAGVPEFQANIWHGLSGPAGMPRPIVERLNKALNKALAHPVVIERFTQSGSEAVSSTPEEYDALVRSETKYWGAAAKRAKAAGK